MRFDISSHGRRRILRPTALLTAVVASLTCNDSPLGPGMEVSASFNVQQLLSAAEDASIPIDSLVIELRRVNDSTIAHTTTVVADSVELSSDGGSVAVEIRIPMESNTEQFYMSLAVIGDGILWLEVSDVITVEAGGEPTTTSELIPAFVGPGANATDIAISLSDTTITGGDSLLISCTVYEGDAVADSALVSFYSSDSTKVATPVSAGYGSAWVHAPAALNDTVTITAEVMTAGDNLATSGVLRFFARPETLRSVSGDDQSMLVGETAVQPIVVQVIDAAGNPYSRGFPVEFAVTTGPTNTTLDQPSVLSDVEGYASTFITAGETVGEVQVTATADGLSGSPIAFAASVVPGAPATMVVNDGDAQTTVVGTSVSTSPSVIVTDDNGDPVTEVIVEFSVVSGGGSISDAVDTTDASGVAAVGSWTLGTSVGSNELVATSTGLSPVTFTATGVAAAPSSVNIVSGDGQSGAGGAQLSEPLVVAVADQYGNGIPNVQVNWATDFGLVDPATTQTDVSGEAQTDWTLDPDSAMQTATATVSGLAPATFTATLSVGAQNIVIADGDNQTATVGATLPVSPSVNVTDGGGNPVPGEEVVFAVASGGGTVTGDTVLTDVDGIARVGVWTLGQIAGTNTLTATVAGLPPVTFTATGTADAADTVLVVSGDDQTADGGSELPAPLVVRVEDRFGNPVANETVNWQALNGSVTPSSSTTDASGSAQTAWTLGLNATSQTASATVSGLTPVVFSATATFPNPTILMTLVGTDRISVGNTAVLEFTLSTPAGPGGVSVTVESDNPSLIAIQPPETVTIAEGNSSGQVTLEGVAGGSTTIRANAAGFTEGSLVVAASLQVLSLPQTANVPYGGTASLPLTISTPAPPGGEVVNLISSDPSIVSLQTSTVTIPEGSFTASATVAGIAPGTATVSATSSTHGAAQSTVSSTANLNIEQRSASINEVFGTTITVRLESGGNTIAAPSPGIEVTLTADDPTCVAVSSPVTIPAGLVETTASVTYGGSATTPCGAVITATASNITSDDISVSVDVAPGITLYATTVGSGLQRSSTGYLGASNHGGVDIVLTSSDPSVMLISPDNSTAGTESITIPVANGTTSFSYYVQGVEGQVDTVALTASANDFSEGTSQIGVVQPAVTLYALSNSTTSLSPDDPFQARVGIPDADNTYMAEYQSVRAGGPGSYTATVSSSDTGVGQLVTTATTGDTVTVEIAERSSVSPSSVAAGGVAFDPVGAGTVTIAASIPGFVTLPLGYSSQQITVTAPNITAYPTTVGGGLQRSVTGYLGASNHGGVDVVLSSSDPSVMLLSPDAATAGAASITIPVSDGSTSFGYYVQGIEGQVGTVDLTVAASGFTDDTVQVEVRQPALTLYALASSTTSLSPDDPFQVRIGIPDADQTYMAEYQSVRAGAPGSYTATVTVSDATVGQLVTTQATGDTVTVEIVEGTSLSPGTVAAGGVAFDPVDAGTTLVAASIPGFITLPLGYSSQEVTVAAPALTLYEATVGGGLQEGRTGYLGASNHGGVDVELTSSDPSLMLLSPDASTAGTESITISLTDGATSFSYFVQGLEGQVGATTLTATATGFTTDSVQIDVVQPAVAVYALATTTTSLSYEDAFQVRIGVPDANQSYMASYQEVRAGAPGSYTATVSSSAPGVGQLVTNALSAGEVTVEIAEGLYYSPGTVDGGGVAFDPLTAGTTTVSASIPGFVTLPLGVGSVEVTVSAPAITVYSTTVGSGLQTDQTLYLEAANHGGVEVTITSSNQSVLLLAPNDSTAGADEITLSIPDGSTSASYWVQGLESTTGTVTITVAAPGFIDGSAPIDVVQPAVLVYGLSASKTTDSGDDAFTVRVGIPNASQTYMSAYQSVRAGSSTSYDATVTNSDAAVGQLVTTDLTGQSVSVEIAEGSFQSPTDVASGGVAFEVLETGTTTVSVALPGFVTLPLGYGSIEVTVTTP